MKGLTQILQPHKSSPIKIDFVAQYVSIFGQKMVKICLADIVLHVLLWICFLILVSHDDM